MTKKILVIRNDKIGDFMLAWPAIALIKKQYPDSQITALVPEYTRPIAEQCRWIDHIIIDKKQPSLLADIKHLITLFNNKHFDASISLFSETRTAMALWVASIPIRVAPATKFAQVFYTHRLRQRRSRSEKPEHVYNINLAQYFITSNGDTPVTPPAAPYLVYDAEQITRIKNDYLTAQQLNSKTKLIIIHPGSGGSAINLSIEQYAKLARLTSARLDVHVIITAGPTELEVASDLANLLTGISHSIYHSTRGLVEFSKFINICDLFISGSTGPLHIAGALNIPTAAFYPARRSATALRWQTLNVEDKRLAFMPEQHIDDKDMQKIKIEDCSNAIIALLSVR